MLRDYLIHLLKNNDCEVKFTKKDGTIRIMTCTLDDDRLPSIESEPNKSRRINEEVLNVYTPDGWRSFRIDSLIYLKIIG
jgi:hypothetical protein